MSRMYWHRLKNRLSFQRWSQLGFFLLINSYAKGFQSGQIFAGASKSICVPVLNCYSCPGALGACPIGALQTVLGRGRFPFYVLGLMMAFGVVLGRAICGLLCPFGLVQDLLHKIPLPKYQLPPRFDRARVGSNISCWRCSLFFCHSWQPFKAVSPRRISANGSVRQAHLAARCH